MGNCVGFLALSTGMTIGAVVPIGGTGFILADAGVGSCSRNQINEIRITLRSLVAYTSIANVRHHTIYDLT